MVRSGGGTEAAATCYCATPGTSIPRTVITNDPNAVREFREQCAGMTIYKSLSPAMNLVPGKTLYTSPLTEATLSRIDLIQDLPEFFKS